MQRSYASVLILIIAISSLALFMVKPAQGQNSTATPASTITATPMPTPYSPNSVPINPSIIVPQYTVALADHSYDVPPVTTTTTDPYTGKQITNTQPGYHVENKTIDITITNQPAVAVFHQYFYGVNLYYDVRVKGHYTDSWSELSSYDGDGNNLPVQSTSGYTVISIPQNNYPSDGLVDFQIRAVNGTVHALYPGNISPFAYWTYEASGWSNIETLSMADGSVSVTVVPKPTPTPTLIQIATPTVPPSPSPTIPEFSVIVILPLLTVIPFIVALILRNKTLQKFTTRSSNKT